VKRVRHPFAAWLALFALCFAQIATAAHACALLDVSPPVPPAEVQGTPCADMAIDTVEDRPILCLEHCKFGQQVVDDHAAAPIDAPVVVPLIVAAVDICSVRLPLRGARTFAPSFSPPVFASSSRLRI
jgi:hypothetical protein